MQWRKWEGEPPGEPGITPEERRLGWSLALPLPKRRRK